MAQTAEGVQLFLLTPLLGIAYLNTTFRRDFGGTVRMISGNGPLRKAVEAHASDHLLALGYVSDDEKWRWFADADVFASLSAYEGMPVATAEALSFDLPVVLSDIPAHRHLVETYGATAELVTPDRSELATAIPALAGRRSDVTLPEWADVTERYLSLVR